MRKKLTALFLVLILVMGCTVEAYATRVTLFKPFDYDLKRSGRTIKATTFSYYKSMDYSFFIRLASTYVEGEGFDIVKTSGRGAATSEFSVTVKIPKGHEVISYSSYHEIYYRGKLIHTETVNVVENELD